MPTAEIITIGTEILLGEIVDTNTSYISRKFRENGIDLYRQTTIGDNIERISKAIQESMGHADIIITTGGLGPTVDDPTRQAVALALGVETEFRDELWEQVQDRHRRFGRIPTENNKRQAYVPQGATAVENPVGTAPAFIVETDGCTIIALPGVPREMEHLMEVTIIPYLRRKLDLTSVIIARLIHTAGVGESQIDDLIGDLEHLSNPTIGLAAHAGQVDVRITAKAKSQAEAEAMIQAVEQQVRRRLGEWIYGADQQTLEQVALNHLSAKGWQLVVIEAGLNGELIHRLASVKHTFVAGKVIISPVDAPTLVELLGEYQQDHDVDIAFGVSLHPGPERQEVILAAITPHNKLERSLSYGGPPGYAARWAVHQALDMIRKL
jgi:competence/damage-inducible protein CinA-like protein